MPEGFDSLRRYMPEWMARRGADVLGSLPQDVRRWVEDTAQQIEASVGPPDREAWRDEIVRRFCAGQDASRHETIVHGVRSAVLLVAILQMPPPELVPGQGPSVPADSMTKKLDRVAVKRSRILGMIETGLGTVGEGASSLLAGLGR